MRTFPKTAFFALVRFMVEKVPATIANLKNTVKDRVRSGELHDEEFNAGGNGEICRLISCQRQMNPIRGCSAHILLSRV